MDRRHKLKDNIESSQTLALITDAHTIDMKRKIPKITTSFIDRQVRNCMTGIREGSCVNGKKRKLTRTFMQELIDIACEERTIGMWCISKRCKNHSFTLYFIESRPHAFHIVFFISLRVMRKTLFQCILFLKSCVCVCVF